MCKAVLPMFDIFTLSEYALSYQGNSEEGDESLLVQNQGAGLQEHHTCIVAK
jgi:hypothetical protein